MGPNHHHHSHINSIEEVCPIKGANLNQSRYSSCFSHFNSDPKVRAISSSIIFFDSIITPSHHTRSGYVITFTVVKVVSTLTESMPYVDSGLFNNQRLHLSHRSVLLYLIKVRFHIKISSSVSNPIYIQTNKFHIDIS